MLVPLPHAYHPVLAVMGSCFESFYGDLTFYRTDTSLRQTVGPVTTVDVFERVICVENPALSRQIRLPCNWLEGIRQEKFNSTEKLERKFRTIGCFCLLITGSQLNHGTMTRSNVTAFSPDLLQKHK